MQGQKKIFNFSNARFTKGKISQLVLVVVNNALDFFSILLVTKLASKFLSKEDYGFYALMISVYTLISVIPFLSLHPSFEKYIVEYVSQRKLKNHFVYFLAIHLLFFSVYALGLSVGNGFLSERWRSISWFIYAYLLAKVYRTMLLVTFNIQQKRLEMLWMRLIELIVLVGIIFLGSKYSVTFDAVFFLNIGSISSLVAVFYALYCEREILQIGKLSKRRFYTELKKILYFSYPFIIWGVFLWLQNMIFRWYLDMNFTTSTVADYSLMASLALMPASAYIAVVSNFFVPIAYKKETTDKGFIAGANRKLVWYSIIFWAAASVVFLVGKNQMVLLFLDAKYLDVAWCLPYLIIGCGIYAIGQMTIYEIYFYNKAKLLIVSNVLPGCFALIFGYFFIKKLGYNGAVISHVATYVLSGVITLATTFWFSRNNSLAL